MTMKTTTAVAAGLGAIISSFVTMLLLSNSQKLQQPPCLAPQVQDREHHALTGDPTDPRDDQSLPDDHPDLVYLREYGRISNLPSDSEIKAMTDKEVHYIYHSYLDNIDLKCRRKFRLGNSGDGGYEVCDDFLYRPMKPCLVYSFGIRNDFSFDDAVARLYGCDVCSFDPSMGKDSHKRSERVSFYNIALGGAQGKSSSLDSLDHLGNQKAWDVKSLTQIKAMLGHSNRTIDLLKIDIEYSEWKSMEDIMSRGELTRVRQLLIEFHSDLDNPGAVRTTLPKLRMLEDQGFRRFFTHLISYHPTKINNVNIFPTERRCCYEMGFVNPAMAKGRLV